MLPEGGDFTRHIRSYARALRAVEDALQNLAFLFVHHAVAQGKALGALAFNLGSRRIATMAAERPHFFAGVAHAVGAIVPGAGGVLVRDAGGTILGAVGVSGDTADNDEVSRMNVLSAPFQVLVCIDWLAHSG